MPYDEDLANWTYEIGEWFKNTGRELYKKVEARKVLTNYDFEYYPKQIVCLFLA